MFEYTVDKAQNLLTVKLAGDFNALDTADAANKIKKSFSEFKPGFRVIMDISDLYQAKEHFIPVVREVMELLSKYKPSRVIRIVGNTSAHLQWKRARDSKLINYNIIEVNSYDEAMAELKK